jgi:hypothetical protein
MIDLHNQSPLGQLAKKALEKLEAEADPHYLYPLQLAQWILENQPDQVPGWAGQHSQQLLSNVQVMLGWPTKDSLELLANPEEGESAGDAAKRLATSLRGKSPQALAAILVENLWENLRHQLPSLDSPETPD